MSYFIGIVIGRLTKDPQKNEKNDGGNFTIAVDHGYGDKQTTDFWKCFVSKETLDQMQNAKVKKGSLLQVQGTVRATSEKQTDGSYTNSSWVNVREWTYLPTNGGGKKDSESGEKEVTKPATKESGKAPSFSDFAGGRPVDDDEPY